MPRDDVTEVPATPVEVVEVLTNQTNVVEVVDRGPVGPSGDLLPYMFSKPNLLVAPYTSPFVFPVIFNATVDSINLTVGTPPEGADLILDILRGSETIFPEGVGRPTISDGTVEGTGSTDTPLLAGDLLSIKIVQTGSVVPGGNLTLLLNLKRS